MKWHEENTPTTTTRVVTTKITIEIKIGYYSKKDWNKNTKSSYQKKDDKKESKDKDVYFTLTKDVNFHCPAGFNENIFTCACRMIQEKVNSARQSGITVNCHLSMLLKRIISCVFLTFQKTCMIQHGPRL